MPLAPPDNQTIEFNALCAKLEQYPELYQAVNQLLQSVDNAVGQSCWRPARDTPLCAESAGALSLLQSGFGACGDGLRGGRVMFAGGG